MQESGVLAIHTEGLSKSYKGVTAVNGLTMQVPNHSIYGFLTVNSLTQELPLPGYAIPQLVVTASASAVFILVALWRFGREEL